MLINVRSDRTFQRFLDREEQRLHVQMVPLLSRGIRMQIKDGGVPATNYIVKRGGKILFAHYKRIFRQVYGTVPPIVKADTRGISTFMDRMYDYLEREAGTRIANIAESTASFIRDRIITAVQEGWSNAEIAADLYDEEYDISRNRSATIARTETHSASMWAMDESIDEKGLEIEQKQWWSAQDSRVRDSHSAIHGTMVPRDQPFELEGGDLMYPGDDSLGADAGEIVNCRCTCLYFTATGAD